MKVIIWVKIKDLDLVEHIDSGSYSSDIDTTIDFRLSDLKNRKYNDYVQCLISYDTLKFLYENNKAIINKEKE